MGQRLDVRIVWIYIPLCIVAGCAVIVNCDAAMTPHKLCMLDTVRGVFMLDETELPGAKALIDTMPSGSSSRVASSAGDCSVMPAWFDELAPDVEGVPM